MVRVPSYQLIPFLSWLRRRDVPLSIQRIDPIQLKELAREFLISSRRETLYSLAGIMSIFQYCPMISETNVEEQIYHFTRCGQCIEMMERHYTPKLIEEDISQFHELISGFVKWASDSELEFKLSMVKARNSEPEFRLRSRDNQSFLDRDIFNDEFRHLIHIIGNDLLDHFLKYLLEIRKDNPNLIYSYENFRREIRDENLQREIRDHHTNKKKTCPLSWDESIEQAAKRLAESAAWAIEEEVYDYQVFDYKHRTTAPQGIISEDLYKLCLMTPLDIRSPGDLAQALEFLDWLRQDAPDIKIPGSIPSIKLQELVLKFCEEKGYSNSKSLSEEINQWLMGKGSNQIIDVIAKFLKLKRRPKSLNWQSEQHNPLDRYGSVKFHALFLFMSYDNFQSSMEAHWRDLNYLTGDDLDIYFSQKDLSERVSGYEITNALPHLKLRVNILPALLLWEDKLETNTMIPLKALDPKRVVEVMKTVVQAIRDGCTIEIISQRGKSRSIELQRERENEIVIQGGGSVKYVNNGNITGNLGPNGHFTGNIVIQNAKETQLEKVLTSKDIDEIKNLMNKLMFEKIKGIEDSERIEGALYLAKIAEAKNKCDQEENLAGWKIWLDSLGERGKNVLSVLADVVTVVSPIAPLLGLRS